MRCCYLRQRIAPVARSGAVLALFSLTDCDLAVLPFKASSARRPADPRLGDIRFCLVPGFRGWFRSQHSPTLNLLGSYFPAWMLCAAAGVVTAVVIRQVLVVVGIGEYVVAPLLTYAGVALGATWLIWLLLFGH